MLPHAPQPCQAGVPLPPLLAGAARHAHKCARPCVHAQLSMQLEAILDQYEKEDFDLGIKQFMIEQAIQQVRYATACAARRLRLVRTPTQARACATGICLATRTGWLARQRPRWRMHN